MKRLFTIAFWTIAVYGWGQSTVTEEQTNALIAEIDEAVANADTYIAEKERQISLLQQQWQQAPDTEQRYAAAKALWKAYSSFQNDSAVVATLPVTPASVLVPLTVPAVVITVFVRLVSSSLARGLSTVTFGV